MEWANQWDLTWTTCVKTTSPGIGDEAHRWRDRSWVILEFVMMVNSTLRCQVACFRTLVETEADLEDASLGDGARPQGRSPVGSAVVQRKVAVFLGSHTKYRSVS